jgi:hypothetical protein
MVGLRATDLANAAEREDPSTGTSFVAAVRARYAPAVTACNLIADAHDAWVDELDRALTAKEAGQPYTLDATLAAHVIASWTDVQDALYLVGVHLGQADPALEKIAATASALDAGVDGGVL